MMIPVIRSRWIPLKKADFEEDKHPRKNDGKFAPKGEGEIGNGDKSKRIKVNPDGGPSPKKTRAEVQKQSEQLKQNR
jgi:hypothetical protein